MARPKKQPHEKRTASTRADLTSAEKLYLGEQASRAGLTEAEYVRRRALGHQVSPAPSRADAALITEINRLGVELRAWGVNLNQLARDENAGRQFHGDWVALRDRLNYELDEVERVLAKVATGYGA